MFREQDWNGTVVRVLASHQSGPGSSPGPVVIHGLGFFSGFSTFPPSTKTNTSKFQFDLESVDKVPLCGMCHTSSSYRL